jgi:hypothetical protein
MVNNHGVIILMTKKNLILSLYKLVPTIIKISLNELYTSTIFTSLLETYLSQSWNVCFKCKSIKLIACLGAHLSHLHVPYVVDAYL